MKLRCKTHNRSQNAPCDAIVGSFQGSRFSDYSIVYEYQEGIRPGVEMEQEN